MFTRVCEEKENLFLQAFIYTATRYTFVRTFILPAFPPTTSLLSRPTSLIFHPLQLAPVRVPAKMCRRRIPSAIGWYFTRNFARGQHIDLGVTSKTMEVTQYQQRRKGSFAPGHDSP